MSENTEISVLSSTCVLKRENGWHKDKFHITLRSYSLMRYGVLELRKKNSKTVSDNSCWFRIVCCLCCVKVELWKNTFLFFSAYQLDWNCTESNILTVRIRWVTSLEIINWFNFKILGLNVLIEVLTISVQLFNKKNKKTLFK